MDGYLEERLQSSLSSEQEPRGGVEDEEGEGGGAVGPAENESLEGRKR